MFESTREGGVEGEGGRKRSTPPAQQGAHTGLNPGTLGSGPELEVDTCRTEPPRQREPNVINTEMS